MNEQKWIEEINDLCRKLMTFSKGRYIVQEIVENYKGSKVDSYFGLNRPCNSDIYNREYNLINIKDFKKVGRKENYTILGIQNFLNDLIRFLEIDKNE